jgi:hypothetical protein
VLDNAQIDNTHLRSGRVFDKAKIDNSHLRIWCVFDNTQTLIQEWPMDGVLSIAQLKKAQPMRCV